MGSLRGASGVAAEMDGCCHAHGTGRVRVHRSCHFNVLKKRTDVDPQRSGVAGCRSDLPVTMLIIFLPHALGAGSPSPVIGDVLFPTIFVLLGGLQWYLIASLLARWTYGFQQRHACRFKAIRLCDNSWHGPRWRLCTSPWIAQLGRVLHSGIRGPYMLPTIAFKGDSEDLRQSVVVPTLDTPMPKDKNVVWCGTLQLAWNRLGKDVLHQPPNVQGAETVASRLNEASLEKTIFRPTPAWRQQDLPRTALWKRSNRK